MARTDVEIAESRLREAHADFEYAEKLRLEAAGTPDARRLAIQAGQRLARESRTSQELGQALTEERTGGSTS